MRRMHSALPGSSAGLELRKAGRGRVTRGVSPIAALTLPSAEGWESGVRSRQSRAERASSATRALRAVDCQLSTSPSGYIASPEPAASEAWRARNDGVRAIVGHPRKGKSRVSSHGWRVSGPGGSGLCLRSSERQTGRNRSFRRSLRSNVAVTEQPARRFLAPSR
jgi:hypothetical protein